jgi:predicted TIM-barrel enzyme
LTGLFPPESEETGMSFALEVCTASMHLARRKDLLTTPYVFNEADAKAMANAGADIIVVHLGADNWREHRR